MKTELQQFLQIEIIGPQRLRVDAFSNSNIVIASIAIPDELNPFLATEARKPRARFSNN